MLRIYRRLRTLILSVRGQHQQLAAFTVFRRVTLPAMIVIYFDSVHVAFSVFAYFKLLHIFYSNHVLRITVRYVSTPSKSVYR